MLIVVQFPIADIRLFVEAQTGHLSLPFWPSPKPYQEFIRSFGIVRKRGKGGIQGWIGENEICDARHAIKIDKPIIYNLSNGRSSEKASLRLKNRSRHFYFDGMAVAKFEMVFATIPFNIDLSPELFSSFLMDFVKTKIKTPKYQGLSAKDPNPQDSPEEIPLKDLGKYLSKQYLCSTTKKSFIETMNEEWAMAGEPIFWMEFSTGESLPIPAKAHLVPSFTKSEVSLYHWDLSPQKNKVTNIWLAKYHTNTPESKQICRTARIMLTRLNAEQETLWAVLKMIDEGKIGGNNGKKETQALRYLQHYFNEATRRVFRLQKSREKFFEPSEVGLSIRTSLEYVNPGRKDSLLQKLKLIQIRPQVAKKIREYINQIFITENIMGDKVIGDKVGGDKYSIGQAGVVGPGAQANNINFYNAPDTTGANLELEQLAEELKKLREAMELQSKGPNHEFDIEKIAVAEEAAKNGEQSKVLEILNSVGTWTFGIAEKIGVTLVTAAIKSALGI